jgi:hypothetical protein
MFQFGFIDVVAGSIQGWFDLPEFRMPQNPPQAPSPSEAMTA